MTLVNGSSSSGVVFLDSSSSIQQEVSATNWNGREIAENALQSLQDQAQSAAAGISTLFSGFTSFIGQMTSSFTTPPKIFDIDEEIKGIRGLPNAIQELIGSFIDPVGDLVRLVEQGKEIPEYLRHHARHVTTLKLGWAVLTESQILKLLKCCENLETLEMPRPFLESTYVKYNQNVYEIILCIAALENLECLDMSSWIVKPHPELSTDDMIAVLVSNGKLQYLNLEGYNTITDIGVCSIVDQCKDLQHLNLNECFNISDHGLQLIAQLPNICFLGLDWNQKISNEGLAHLSTLSNLQHLSLLGISKITDEGVVNISKCNNLEHLALSQCHNLTSAAIQSIISLKQLKQLTIRDSDFVDDEVLEVIGTCTQLQYLDLSGCKHITTNGYSNISMLTELTNLILKRCLWINDDTLKCLYPLKKLKILDLFGAHISPQQLWAKKNMLYKYGT